MTDDRDLDAQLRAGARAFPPAPTPDSSRLRDVLTTSRRRSRRVQGGVLACAGLAVAGGTALAVSGGQPSRPAVVARATSTAIAGTEPASPPPAPTWQGLATHYCANEYDTTYGELNVLIVSNEVPGRDLADEFQALTVDGYDVLDGPPAPDGEYVWPREIVIDASHMSIMFASLGDHELALTVDGVTSTFDVLEDPGDVIWPLRLASQIDGLTFEWQPLDELCESPPPTTSPDPSSVAPPGQAPTSNP
jgi:hypothetical protein